MGKGYITRPAAWGQQGRKGRVQATIKSTLSSQLMITTSMDHLNGVLKLPWCSKQCLLLWTGGWQVRMSGWKEMECKTLQVVHSPPSNFTRLGMLAKVSQNPTFGHGLDTFGSVFLCPKLSQKLELIWSSKWARILPFAKFCPVNRCLRLLDCLRG